jgi:2-iminobutanoate/2-iminopropanoate deaminase
VNGLTTRMQNNYNSNRVINFMKTKIETPDAPPATGPFSQAIIAGNFVFTGGQIALNPEGKLNQGTIEEQTHQVMKNLNAILTAAGVTFSDVVKATVYITDLSLFGRVNEVYKSYLSEPYPARETTCVKDLVLGARLEISMIAMKS